MGVSRGRRLLIVILFLVDATIHTALLFGWSSITEIMKENDFFRQSDSEQNEVLALNQSDQSSLEQITLKSENESCFVDNEEQGTQSQEIALIFTLTTSLLGIFILIHGFIRDYVGYGVARLEIYFLLSLSYALLGISSPGSSDVLQYFWIIQFGCTIGAYLNGMQYFTLFPNQFGFLIGLANGLANVSSILPQLWLIMIRNDILSYSEIMFIWAALAFVSLLLGIFVYPWHNLPNTYEEIEIVGVDSMVSLCKKKKPLIRKDGDSLVTQFKQNSSYLKSPVFLVVLISFIVGNFNVSLSLNVLNDLICRSANGNLEEFASLQTSSEILRVIASVLICPIVGFISDILMNFWKKYENGSVDVLYTLPCYFGMTTAAVGLGVSLFWTNIWPTMTFIAFLNGLIYTFENIIIVQSFPINSHGIMFAIVELTSSLINFSQIPITDAVKLNQNFDLLTYLLIGLSLIIVLSAFPLPCIGFSVGPKFLLEMDGPRYRSINNLKLASSDENDSELKSVSNDAFQTNEETHQF